MRYIKDFARILVLKDEGFNDTELRIVTGLSDKTIREYIDLIETYSTEDYQDRFTQLHAIFRKKTIPQINKETAPKSGSGRWSTRKFLL